MLLLAEVNTGLACYWITETPANSQSTHGFAVEYIPFSACAMNRPVKGIAMFSLFSCGDASP